MGGGQSHSLLNYIDMNNISKINKVFEINKEKVGKYMINSDIQIKFPTVEELKNIDLLIMTIPSHEKYAFENEITVFMNKNEYKGDILKMAHGIDLIKQY